MAQEYVIGAAGSQPAPSSTRVLAEGARGRALHPELGKMVQITYQRRDYEVQGVMITDLLVGVHEPDGQVLSVPAQSLPRVQAALRDVGRGQG